MRTQAQIEELFHRLYRESGNDPADLIHIKPVDEKWEDALSYEVTRKDGKRTRVYRKDLDDRNEIAIKSSLILFG
jgi:hypothetical protein